MPVRKYTLEDRLKTIPTIFDQDQNTTSVHSKDYVALFKVHQEAAKVTESVNDGEGLRLTGERAFEDSVIEVVKCVVVVKKGESVAAISNSGTRKVSLTMVSSLDFNTSIAAEAKRDEDDDD